MMSTIQATLWSGQHETSTILRELLQLIFARAEIPLKIVATQEEVLAAAATAKRATDQALLLIDCLTGSPTDVDRCMAVITQTTLPVFIIHPRQEAVQDLEKMAGRALDWLPSPTMFALLLDRLQVLKAASTTHEQEAPLRLALTPREREVHQRAMAGHSVAAIAAQLGIAENTVKTHLANARRKLPPAETARQRAGAGPEE